MLRYRFLTSTILVALGFALATGDARGQRDISQVQLSPAIDKAVTELRNGGNPFDKGPADKLLADFMKHYVEKLNHPGMFSAAQELRPASELPMDNMLSVFARFVLVPELGKRYGVEQSDYIVEFGKTFVAAFKPILESNPGPVTPVVRLNAARLMAAAARCGAPAFGPLITDLVEKPNTPPEIKFYAFKAAEGLLAAYDILKLTTPNSRDHTLRPPELAALASALESHIFDSKKVLTFPAGAEPKQPSAEMGAVVAYIRRQAVRALAQVRFASLKGANDQVVYCAYDLSRVAMSDPVLAPAPGPVEIADAVVGLCEMQPGDSLMMDAAADAVATGILSFAGTLNAQNSETAVGSTPWKLCSARLRQGLVDWKRTAANSVPANRQPKAATDLADLAIESVLSPLERQGAAAKGDIHLEKVIGYRQALRANPNTSKTLFRGVAGTPMEPLQK